MRLNLLLKHPMHYNLLFKHSVQLMVAEKKGIIRFYSLATQQAFLSLDCGHVPLISADWCNSNTVRVAAVAGTDWVIFDTSRSRYDGSVSCWTKTYAYCNRAENIHSVLFTVRVS